MVTALARGFFIRRKMELTFDNMTSDVQSTVGDTSADSLVLIKRWINTGASLITNELRRHWTQERKFTDLVADQNEYQMPESSVRPSLVRISSGGRWYPVNECADSVMWAELSSYESSSSIPTLYHVRGKDIIELYPTPSESVTAGLELSYEPRHKAMTQSDYSTGTVTVANGSAVITGYGTSWTAAMVGRIFKPTGVDDEQTYRISAYTSPTSLTLENYYAGNGASGLTYTIGESPNLPPEYQEGCIDYAKFRYYMLKGDSQRAQEYRSLFEGSIDGIKEAYSSASTNRVMPGIRYSQRSRVYNPLIDPPML